MDREQILYKIKHLIPFIMGRFKNSGYEPLPADDRDFKIGSFFGKLLGETYTPQHDEVNIPTLGIKDQGLFNTCVFNSAIAGKEVDEGVILSVRSLVAYSRRQGYITDNGFSNLRSAQKALQDWGAQEEKDLPDGTYADRNDFEDYTNVSLDQAKAALHKSKTYWSVSTKNDILRLLDQNRPLHCAIPWQSGYNQGGGFTYPWVIKKSLGYFIGGHALAVIGYKKNYQGCPIAFKIQNSYSKLWGDNGCFWIDSDFFVQQINIMGYGVYVNLDLDSEFGAFLNKYDAKNVKTKSSPAIYFIQEGKKKAYPDWPTYLAWDGNLKGFTTVSDADAALLNKLPVGDNMDIKKSVYWDVIAELKLSDDKDGHLINALFQMQYNKKLGMPLKANL